MKRQNHKQSIVIYGDSDFADQAFNQIESDGRYKVLAFTVDESRYKKNVFNDLPVIKFQYLNDYYSTKDILVFVAIGYSKLNTIRETTSHEIENAGYLLMTYISKHAFIGSHVEIGKGCYICEFVSIGAKAKIGDGVMIFPNSSVAHDSNILNYSYISRSTIIGGRAIIQNNTFIGLNSTIKNGVEIAEFNIIGSASNVVKSTTANGLYVGNPARRVKEIDLDANTINI